MRRDFHEHMDMFSRQNAGDDLDAKFLAQLPDNRSYPLPQRAFQHLVAILRDPDHVIRSPRGRVDARANSLMEQPVLHIWTHDSISLGEYGRPISRSNRS